MLPADTPTFVFVYGTLRRGGRLHGYLEGQGFIGEATLPGFGLYPAGAGSFPGIVPHEGLGPIVGEIYEVDPDCLWRLDRLEGHPNHYRRQEVKVTFGEGVAPYMTDDDPIYAYIHQIPPANPEWIESGDWLKFIYGDEDEEE